MDFPLFIFIYYMIDPCMTKGEYEMAWSNLRKALDSLAANRHLMFDDSTYDKPQMLVNCYRP